MVVGAVIFDGDFDVHGRVRSRSRPTATACLNVVRGFVMPAEAGIHPDSLGVANMKMDSGLRRNDGSENSRRVAIQLSMKTYIKSRIKISAICTALSAAPLRRLSDTTQRLRPLAIDLSSRILPTKVASFPAASMAMG